MNATIHNIRPFQSAAQFKDRSPRLYVKLVRAICAEQREGRRGFAPIHEAKRATQPSGGALA
jgi:hypothetical protein